MKTGALLLAAGSSRRFRAAKLLADLEGQPLIAHAAHALKTAGRETLVVTGANADAIRTALKPLNLHFVHAPDHALGMAHSLRAGLAAAPKDWDAALIMLADMPDLEPEFLAQLAATPGIAVPIWKGRRGNPVRWPRAHWPALMALNGDTGAKKLLASFNITEVPAPSNAIHRDIDTPEALAEALAARAP